MSKTSYDTYTREELIARIHALESSSSRVNKQVAAKPFDFSAHPTQKIALKFTYDGSDYNGLACQNETADSGVRTVEGEIFKAMSKLKWIDESKGLSGCDWERCGRTDRGVSSAGQVMSLTVRSGTTEPIAYVAKLNRMLPGDIRMLAWAPVEKDFSARFNCKARHYKYFFSTARMGGLDVGAMEEAAQLLVGEHDFRNLCKIDPSKQLTHFRRRVLSASISAVGSTMHVLDLVGSAFLYHQVRHIMAVLFLVGQHLEEPSIVARLLHTSDVAYPGIEGPVVDQKPDYAMAEGLPLMLWDCIYSDGELNWQTDQTEAFWDAESRLERASVRAALEAHYLEATAAFHPVPPTSIVRASLGAGSFMRQEKYVPLLERKRMEGFEMQNERWAKKRTSN